MKIIINYILIFILYLAQYVPSESAWLKVQNITPSKYRDRMYLDIMFLKSNPNYGWACGFDGTIIRTTDRGKTWNGIELIPGVNCQLESINFINENIGYVSGPVISNFKSYSVLFKSTDGGKSWFDITPDPQNSFWGNYFADQDNGVLLGGSCGFQLFYHTSDGGNTWSVSSANVKDSKMSDALIFSSNGIGYAVGSGTFWITNNGGKDWRYISDTGNRDWHEDIAVYGNTVILPISPDCDGQTDANSGGIAISNDLGLTWKRFKTKSAMFGSFLIDEHKGWATGMNRAIYYTSDGGTTWSLNNCGIPNNVDLDDVYFVDDTTGWACGDGIYTYYVPNYPKPTINADKNLICEGDTAVISIGGKYDKIVWNNGQIGPTIKVTKPGIFNANVYVDSICYNSQTADIYIDYFPKQDIDISYKGKFPPCDGDTISLIAGSKHKYYSWNGRKEGNIINVFNSGTYTIDVIDSNGCANSKSIEIQFNQLPKPKIFSLTKDTICIGEISTLYPDKEYKSYKWIDKSNGNIISNNKNLTIKSSGDYYLVVTDTNGCEGVSNIKSIYVRNTTDVLTFTLNRTTFHYIDSTNYKQQKCSQITIINNSNNDFYLKDAYLFRNTSFSLPLNQFPLIIPALDSINLLVCFSPSSLGEIRDTIHIEDNCGYHDLPLTSYGILSNSIAQSKCEVPLIFSPNKIEQSFSAVFLQPTPNPANNSITLYYEITIPENENVKINSFITNILGDKLTTFNNEIIAIENKNGIIRENGKISYNISNLTSGYYLLLCNIQNNTISFPIIIQR